MEAFATHPVAANLLLALITLAGFNALPELPRQTFPEFEMDQVRVTALWKGAGPAQVEEGVVRRVEEALNSVEGVRRLLSTAEEGRAIILLDLFQSVDLQETLDEVKNVMDRLTELPKEVDVTVTSSEGGMETVLRLAVFGTASERALRLLAQETREELQRLGVARVTLGALREREMRVSIHERARHELGLTPRKVARLLKERSLDEPLGTLRTLHDDGEKLLRYRGQRYTASEFRKIPLITSSTGDVVRLGDVADVRDDFEEEDFSSRYNGKRAVLLSVSRASGEDALQMSELVKRYVTRRNAELPESVRLEVWGNFADVIQSRLDLLTKNAMSGFVLVLLVLLIFLNGRTAFWVAVGIPVSFLGAFAVLQFRGESINMINMFGLILALGIVVDDGIVVGENITRHREEGATPTEAALRGLREVMTPVACSTLTTIAAFLPLMTMPGRIGKLIIAIPTILIAVLLISLLEVVLALPAHLRKSMARHDISGAGATRTNKCRDRPGIERIITRFYLPFLTMALRYRYVVIATAAAFFMTALGAVIGGWIPFTFFPSPEGDMLIARVVFPVGTPLKRTEAMVVRVEEGLMKHPETAVSVRRLYTSLGRSALSRGVPERGGHLAEILVELLPSEQRLLSAKSIAVAWREKIRPLPGLETLTISEIEHAPIGRDVDVRLFGDEPAVLKKAALKLRSELARLPGLSAIEDDLRPGKEEIRLMLTPVGRAMGFSDSEVANQVRAAFLGETAQRFQDGRDEVTVRLLAPEQFRKSRSQLEGFFLRTPEGADVLLSDVVDIRSETGFSRLHHYNRKLSVTVTADVDSRTGNMTRVHETLQERILPDILNRYGVDATMEGQAAESDMMRQGMIRGMILAVVMIYIILAWVFRSYRRPFVLMAAIPFGVIGAVFGHWLLEVDLTILSLIGLMGLSGIVVNDAIVLLDFTHRQMADGGKSPTEAVMAAGQQRFRAVLLTSITTIAGLFPLLLERSMQAQFLIPMAISITFGLMVATVLILIIIPCLFVIQEETLPG